MLNNRDTITDKLIRLGLDHDEAKVYLELLNEPSTHMRLSVITGINRTKVYRIAEDLMKRSLVAKRTDDTGMFLVAADPATLEVMIVDQEEKIKQQRQAFTELLPTLESLKTHDKNAFIVRTYEGVEGLKQMFWHELKTRGELLSLGGQLIEELIIDHYWAERHRELSVQASYKIREIINYDIDLPTYSKNEEFMKSYSYRQLPSNFIYFNEQMCVYNDTVEIFSWRDNKKVGVEIISPTYATAMRNIFEHYWILAREGANPKTKPKWE